MLDLYESHVHDTNAWADVFGLEGDDNVIRIYDKAEYHGSKDTGCKSKAPEDGQGQIALDDSEQAKPSSFRRIGVDYENNEIVILDRTGKRPDGVEVYHSHVRDRNDTSKDGISTEQRNAPRKAGLVDKKK